VQLVELQVLEREPPIAVASDALAYGAPHTAERISAYTLSLNRDTLGH
jgi:hypothetical protein